MDGILGFSEAEIYTIEANLHRLPEYQRVKIHAQLEELKKRKEAEKARENLLEFGLQTFPNFMVGPHHKKIAEVFEAIAKGEKKRVIINIAPRHGKSVLSSTLLPAWFMGKFPNKKIIMGSHTADLAVDFGRKVRDMIADPSYKLIFPDVDLKADAKAAGRWNTNKGGEYYACGVGGALAGRGADLFIIDDPHSEQEAMSGNPSVFINAWEWFQSGPLQRLMPGGAIVILMTRWSKLDLTGQLINHMTKNPDADQWEVIEFPAILPSGKSLWPEFWPIEQLLAKKAGMSPWYWDAQYMQNPTTREGALIKAEWWQNWEKENPPSCDYTIMSLDAAQEAHNRADYSAITVWGVFDRVDPVSGTTVTGIILLNAWKERMEFPELKRTMLAQYKDWKPDTFIVEKKSAGAQLYQEFRSMGLPVTEFTPSKGNDKIARVNSISDMFASGMVWAPKDRRWVQEVIQECQEFPAGEHDDYVDSVTQALIRIRKGGLIRLPSDYEDEDTGYRPPRKLYNF